MRVKRLLAAAMAAAMLVSSALVNTGMPHVYAQEENTIPEGRAYGADQKKIEEAKETEENWNGIVEVPEDKKYKEFERKADAKDLKEITDGVKSSEDAVQVENKKDAASQKEDKKSDKKNADGTTIEKVDRSEVTADLTKDSEHKTLKEQTVKDDEPVRVIILMDGEAVLESNPDAKWTLVNKVKSALIERKQNSVVSKIEKNVLNKKELDIKYHYTWLVNGVAAEVPFGMIDEIEEISGVKKVVIQQVYSTNKEEIAPYTLSDGVMIGREETWGSGYTGKGIKIAIVDTGLDSDHPSFEALPKDALTEESATKDTVSKVLQGTNAADRYEGLNTDQVYYSTKVAYGFNYVDRNLDITHDNDTQGDHGTHVAGIAAANELDNEDASVGVAPDAQLYVMKVFGKRGGAYTEDIVAALEDSLILGADVVNMSLGSPAGFSNDAEWIDEVYARVSETNTILAVAAGNASTSGMGNMWGLNTNLAENPDNSTVSSPATYANVTSVASVNNVGMKSHFVAIDNKKFAFSEGSNGTNEPISTVSGKDLDFAVVGNCGQTLEDFTDAEVSGKVALVQRGVTAFSEKIALAEEAGAVACLVYNNASGDFGMDLTGGTSLIPNASISLIAGEYMVAAKAADPELTMQFSEKAETIPTQNGYTMSDFSSWGISPDLSLEPDVTAPGGNIYSTLDNGQYGMMSGTSMASPNLAGISALVMQYAKAEHPDMSASELHNYVNAVVMSTADPLMYAEGLTYSPRNQGAGLANAYSAINTKAYLSVDGNDMPKVELKDDPAKKGNYNYTFHVNNIGDKDLYYSVDTSIETEDVMNVQDYKFMATTPVALDGVTKESGDCLSYTYDYNDSGAADSADARSLYMKVLNGETDDEDQFFRYNLDKDEDADYDDVQAYLDALVGKDAGVDLNAKVVKVKAGETADVNVNVAVSKAGKEYMDANFKNGIYVEGYTVLTAENAGGVDLSIPYMGFYGDWTKAPILDSGYYWEDQEEMTASQYPHILFTQFGKQDWVPGMNPYIDEEFDVNNISLSPNGDGYADYITEMYIGLLRNAATLSFTYEDAVSGEEYFKEETIHANKSFYSPNYGQIIPYVYSWDCKEYDLTKDGKALANDTKLKLKIAATLDYDKHESKNLYDTWEVPITVDTKAPVVNAKKSKVVVKGGKQYLQLTFKDNVGVAAVNILNKSGTNLLAQYPSGDMVPGKEVTREYDITGYGNQFMVVLGDYALNEAAYKFKTDNNVQIPDASKLYGYRVYDDNIKDDSLFGWVGMDKKDASLTVQSSEYYMDYALTAAEYVGGYILAVDANNDLVSIRPGEWDERTKIASLGKKVAELAFDPVDQVLYAFNKSDYSIETIDVVTGEMKKVSKGYITSFTAMTCGNDGTLYVLNGRGELQVFNKETGVVETEVLADTYEVAKSNPSNYSQSMTFDAEEECIYWAGCFGNQFTGIKEVLYKIDVKDGYKVTEAAQVPGNAELVGLLKLDARGYQLPEAVLEGIAIEETGAVLLVGSQDTLTPVIKPWYAPAGTLTWASNDTSVVTVDEDGVLTGVGTGAATVTLATADGKFQAECPVSVVNPKAVINGFVIQSVGGLYNQWIKADLADLKNFETLTEADFVSYSAGEYVDGTIYAYNLTTEFFKIDAETKKATRISAANKEYQVVDMSYDYTNGYMYGIAQSQLDGMTYLVHVDMNTGALEVVGAAMDAYGAPVCAMAVATDGTIYMISYTGLLNKYDLEAKELVKIGLTGYTASQMLQSMAYDHNTNSLYWAMISGSNEVSVAYVDVTSGKALPLGNVDGGAQLLAMYIVPENVPERAEVPVTSVKMLQESVLVLKDSAKILPVEVQPFNATDRNVVWTVADTEVAEVKNGVVVGKKVGTTTATGTLAGFTVEVTLNVEASAGEIRGYVLADMATGAGQFWGAFDDRDLSSGEGIADGSEYMLSAGEYYNGKVYGYGFDEATYTPQYMIFNGKTLELEKAVAGEYPDMRDMAFDYSTGCMYGIGGIRNVEDKCTLYAVDIATGKTYEIAELDQILFGLACSTDGTLYGLSMEGILYKVDKTTAELTEIGETGYYANQYQAMAFDHNTGNLYWAQVFHDPWTWQTSANLLLVDPKDASTEELGQIGTAGCQVSAMHIVPKKEIPTGTPEISRIALSSTSEMMKPGDTLTLSAQAFPISVNLKDAKVTYSSSDDAVATVDADGKVTAVKEGSVKIVAESGAHKAECSIEVVGESAKIQVVNKNGWEISPLLSPNKIDSKVSFPEGMSVIAAAKNSDGFYYAAGEDGYLWKYTEDLKTAEKVGEAPIAEQFDNRDSFNLDMEDPRVTDIAAVDGKVYALGYGVVGSDPWSMMWEYFVYELNLETGAATAAAEVPMDIDRPVAMTFTDKDTIVMFDGYKSYMYSMKLGSSKYDSVKSLVWTQNVVTAGETMGMVYSPKMNRIFLATADDYNNNAKMALYVMNPSTGSIAKVGDAAYNPGMVDLILP